MIDLKKYGFEYREDFFIEWIKYFRVSSVSVEEDGTLYYSVNNKGIYNFQYIDLTMDNYIESLKKDKREIKSLLEQMRIDGVITQNEDGFIKVTNYEKNKIE